MAADLALVRRLEAIGRRSVCLIFSTDPPGLASVQWTTGELDESDAQLADLARRVLAQRDRKLSGLGPEWRQQISGGQADLDSFGVIDAEFARSSAPPDATAPADGSARVEAGCSERELRGGSWFSTPRYVSAAYRNRFEHGYRSSSIGFRVVREMNK